MARRVAFKKKRNNRTGMACVALVVLAVFAVLMIKSFDLRNKLQDYEATQAKLEEQIAKEEARTKELTEYEKFTKTDRYVEEIAKEKLGLVHEGEIIFKSSVIE